MEGTDERVVNRTARRQDEPTKAGVRHGRLAGSTTTLLYAVVDDYRVGATEAVKSTRVDAVN